VQRPRYVAWENPWGKPEAHVFNLEGTPYVLDARASEQVRVRLQSIEERVALLRRSGVLTEQTVKDYYGEKRFEQVAESNAIEGSTLSVGETELAVLKGITITGHDPDCGGARQSSAKLALPK
jgi:hypothetical protein